LIRYSTPMLTKNILKHKYYITAVFYSLGLTAVSLTPLNNTELPSFRFADKIVHFFLYFFLILLWLKALNLSRKKQLYLLGGIILWGIIIEFIQEYYIPSRNGDIFDALANTSGAFTGLILYRKFTG